MDKPLYVTKPLMPELTDYVELLQGVWESGTLTNLGALHQKLEEKVRLRVGHGHVSLWNNGTTALLAMLQAFDLEGEVVVTPFTFPATVHAIAAMGLTPVFADIDSETLTLSPASVAERVTDRTSAILGTHIYGMTCDSSGLGEVARRQGAALLFDGAHSFAVPAPVFRDPRDIGDATILSFHATKLFHSAEGGAIVASDPEVDRRLRAVRNFGILDEDTVSGVGINGKLSELHAAMGLLTIDLIDQELAKRSTIAETYRLRLEGAEGLRIVSGTAQSKQYFVVRIESDAFGESRDAVRQRLRDHGVFSRKYFYPLCSDIDIYSNLPSAKGLPEARRASEEVLALPFFGDLATDLVDFVCDLVLKENQRT